MVLGAKQVNGVKFETETVPLHGIGCGCGRDIVAGLHVAHPQGQPVRRGQFAPRAALGEAPAHGVTLSHGRSPKTDAITETEGPQRTPIGKTIWVFPNAFSAVKFGRLFRSPQPFFGKVRW
jgi:hypothetical protein